MPIQWTSFLETGIGWQDSQHKELFNMINSLLEAMTRGEGRKEIMSLMRFLDNYVIFHFGAEEQIMRRLNYPDAIQHTEEHYKFKRDLAEIRKGVESGEDLLSVLKLQEKSVDWLINHIGKVDRKLGEFLKAELVK